MRGDEGAPSGFIFSNIIGAIFAMKTVTCQTTFLLSLSFSSSLFSCLVPKKTMVPFVPVARASMKLLLQQSNAFTLSHSVRSSKQ